MDTSDDYSQYDYSQYVPHPRFGQRPRITGLDPEADCEENVLLHWHSPEECRIPNTAIPADLSRQTQAIIPVTHYFDVKRRCRDCGRPFIFFAEEQKHWYEELGFGLDSDCIRCVPCRKKRQVHARVHDTYNQLLHTPCRTVDQEIEMAECCLELIEASVFHRHQLHHVRTILNRIPSELAEGTRARFDDLLRRVEALESEKEGQ